MSRGSRVKRGRDGDFPGGEDTGLTQRHPNCNRVGWEEVVGIQFLWNLGSR